MEEQKSPQCPDTEQILPRKNSRYGFWIRLTAFVLVIAILLNFLTGVDFSLLRYKGTDQMVAAQYLMDSTSYLGQNRLQRLKSLLTSVDSFSLNLQAADIAIGKTEYESAAKFLNKAIPLCQDETQKAELFNRLGCVYMLSEEPEQAQQVFDSSIAMNPLEPAPYLLRAQLRYQSGDAAGSVQDAAAYLKYGGNDEELLLTAASICELGGDLDSAEEAMTRKLGGAQDDSDQAAVYVERGRIRYLMGREADAVTDINRARKLDVSTLTGVHYAIVALCEYNAGDYANGREDFLKAARLSEEGKAEYYEQSLLCGYLMSDYEFIEETIAEAKEKKQMTASAYLIEGTLRFAEERYEDAEEALTNSLETGTIVVGAYYYRGLSRLALGNYALAAEDFTNAIHWETDKYGCLFNRGVCYYAIGENALAESDFRNVIKNSDDESLVLSAEELLAAIEESRI